jgi:hypothetical protein
VRRLSLRMTGFVRSGLNRILKSTCHSERAPTPDFQENRGASGATEESPAPRAEPLSGHRPGTQRDGEILPLRIKILRSAPRSWAKGEHCAAPPSE